MRATRRPSQRSGAAAAAALLSLAATLVAPAPARAGADAVPGGTFTLTFSFPLSNLCTYDVVSVDVVPPNATPLSVPKTVTGSGTDSFMLSFLAGAPGTGTAQVTLLADDPGCEIGASVSAFYEIAKGSEPPPPPPPGTGDLEPQKAAKAFRKEARGELREARSAFRDVLDTFCTRLDALEADLAGSSSAASAVDDVIAALNEFSGGLADAAREAASDITVAALFYYLETNGIPWSGVVAGDCATIDQARARLAKDMDKVAGKALRKFKAFSMRVARDGKGAMTGRLEAPAPPEIAPNPDVPGPAPFKKFLDIGPTIALDAPGGEGARQVCTSGSADPADGATVRVQLVLPGSDPEVVLAEGDAPVDPETCLWRICLPEPGDDPIEPGNYTVRASQESGLVSEVTIGVPSGF